MVTVEAFYVTALLIANYKISELEYVEYDSI